MVWINRVLGRKGEWFWVFTLGLITPVFMLMVLTEPVSAPGLKPIDRFLVLGGFVFACYILILGIVGLRVASRTARRIELAPGRLYLSTFGGKKVRIDRSSHWQMRHVAFTRKFHQFLFSKDQQHLVIANGKRSFYISAYTDDFDELAEQLADYFHGAAQVKVTR